MPSQFKFTLTFDSKLIFIPLHLNYKVPTDSFHPIAAETCPLPKLQQLR